MTDAERLADDLFGRVAEAGLGEAHALGELAEEPDVGARFAGRLDGLLRELHKVVAVGALNVGVLEEGGGGQHVVGVVGGVGEEELVDDGEEIGAREAAAHGVLVGRDRAGVGVVDEEGVDAAGRLVRPASPSSVSAWPRADMLTSAGFAAEGRGELRGRGGRTAFSFQENAPEVERTAPPPRCFHAPVSAGSMAMARTAAPPFSARCTP